MMHLQPLSDPHPLSSPSYSLSLCCMLQDLMEGYQPAVLDFAWAILKADVLSRVSLRGHPELIRVLKVSQPAS